MTGLLLALASTLSPMRARAPIPQVVGSGLIPYWGRVRDEDQNEENYAVWCVQPPAQRPSGPGKASSPAPPPSTSPSRTEIQAASGLAALRSQAVRVSFPSLPSHAWRRLTDRVATCGIFILMSCGNLVDNLQTLFVRHRGNINQ